MFTYALIVTLISIGMGVYIFFLRMDVIAYREILAHRIGDYVKGIDEALVEAYNPLPPDIEDHEAHFTSDFMYKPSSIPLEEIGNLPHISDNEPS